MEQVLRGDGQAKVGVCGCGRLHFTYGAVTLHFDREEFLAFAESVGRLGSMVRRVAKVPLLAADIVPNTTACH